MSGNPIIEPAPTGRTTLSFEDDGTVSASVHEGDPALRAVYEAGKQDAREADALLIDELAEVQRDLGNRHDAQLLANAAVSLRARSD